jgi:hypothetical protein
MTYALPVVASVVTTRTRPVVGYVEASATVSVVPVVEAVFDAAATVVALGGSPAGYLRVEMPPSAFDCPPTKKPHGFSTSTIANPQNGHHTLRAEARRTPRVTVPRVPSPSGFPRLAPSVPANCVALSQIWSPHVKSATSRIQSAPAYALPA